MNKQKKRCIIFFIGFIFSIIVPNQSFSQKEAPLCPPLDSFDILPHLAPITQGFTGTCWSYAMVSLLESEHMRIYNDTIKLSEMWFAYFDYLEKFTHVVAHPTDSLMEGSECNAVLYYIDKYGAVPSYAYVGRKKDAPFFDYSTMYETLLEVRHKLKSSKPKQNERLRKKYITVLNKTMTKPPTKFYDRNSNILYTPSYYSKNILKINTFDYYSFMSNAELPFGQRGELKEPDNWWRDKSYYNMPIFQFMDAIKEALQKGFTVVVSGDVTEKTYQPQTPHSWYDNDTELSKMDSLRLEEKKLKKTQDDHSWHIIGFYPSSQGWWFYVKDSAFWDDPVNGYHYIHESYLIRKAVSLYMHKYAARSVVNKIIK